ncbi:hypothetical protein DPMN_125394 [Dreissena polymorpha]|uniref:Uncharacterized protein n=1 Tax=Dreissena polymorpha TaxID=45954 RepID=A0A9D4GY42_DREPO|nr:hypothetical protein DPMN_125394 [Dreissena polymorpha]
MALWSKGCKGAPLGHYRRRPPLNRGVAVALPGSDTGIAPMSAGGVTVDQGSAGTLPGRWRDAAGFHRGSTGTPPGHYRRQPWLCLGFTGINRSLSGVDRDSAGLLTGFNPVIKHFNTHPFEPRFVIRDLPG